MSFRRRLVGVALIPLLVGVALGQEKPEEPAAKPVTVRSPVAHQVFQRDENGRATIPIQAEGYEITDAGIGLWADLDPGADSDERRALSQLAEELKTVAFADGAFQKVPTGGPYIIRVELRDQNRRVQAVTISPIYVGDLWILAGQSNMEGVGDLIDVTPPHKRVMLLGMNGEWSRAEEPLHWLVDSPDPVHSGDPATRAKRSEEQHRTRKKGAGLGLAFATAMTEATGVPIGLVACAHGGTSLAQWDPAKKGEGGNSLYGSMIRQTALAGGRFKGMLWYQGESDAMGPAAGDYAKNFTDFIAAVRRDLNQPELPVYYVQIGRFVMKGDPKGWNAVREAQRTLPERVPNTAVISVIDLELDDLIHVGTQGLKRAGNRLAKVALHELFGNDDATTPTLERVTRGSDNTLHLRFKGVNSGLDERSDYRRGLQPKRHIAGFSIRDAEGGEIPLIFEAAVGRSNDSVVLKLTGPIPAGAQLWYGYGLDPYCNLVDGEDMAVPCFGPIPLDDVK